MTRAGSDKDEWPLRSLGGGAYTLIKNPITKSDLCVYCLCICLGIRPGKVWPVRSWGWLPSGSKLIHIQQLNTHTQTHTGERMKKTFVAISAMNLPRHSVTPYKNTEAERARR